MMKLALSGLLFVLGLVAPSQAQVRLDISEISCNQFVGYKITNPRNIALWLSGYYNGQRGNKVIDAQALTKNAKKLQDYCLRNPQVLVMQAVETLLHE
jgi:acid stress chaperone HdeB